MSHFKAWLSDPAATDAFGAALAQILEPGLIVYLQGELGSGKTALVRALLHASGHVGHVKSPTYTLAEPYLLQLAGRSTPVMHFDLYRMVDPNEFLDAGFRDYFNADTICLVEWPEKAADLLPAADLVVFLHLNGRGRDVELQPLSAKGQACLARLKFAQTH